MVKTLSLLLLTILPPRDACAQLYSIPPISNPRFASGDIDGDGEKDIIVGGRVGPFRALTDPLSDKHARVDLYKREGNVLTVLTTGPELNQVDDVATGNLDHKKGAEILAVGAGRLIVLGWDRNHLVRLHTELLPSNLTQRIETIDIDSDGIDELIITLYGVGEDGDSGKTTVNIYAWSTSSLRLLQSLEIDSHVGDLAVVANSAPKLVLETGTGEEGGEARMIGLGLHHHWEVWRGQITDGSRRSLSLSSIETGQLAVGTPNGTVRLYQVAETELYFKGTGPELRNTAGILLVRSQESEITLIGGSKIGPHDISLSTVSF
jgi:hypothetical protein